MSDPTPDASRVPPQRIDERLVAPLRRALRDAADPGRAAHDRAYLKTDERDLAGGEGPTVHLGVAVPVVRRLVTAAVREAQPDHDQLFTAVTALWSQPVHDDRLAAVELLAASRPLVGADDLRAIEGLLRRCGTWALVDGLAGTVVGRVAASDPAGSRPIVDGWRSDDDVWIRRSSVLALLGPVREWGRRRPTRPGTRGAAGPSTAERDAPDAGAVPDAAAAWAWFEATADVLLDDRTFWVRKALGWVARDHGHRHPEMVAAWLATNGARMSAVTRREAAKPLRRPG